MQSLLCYIQDTDVLTAFISLVCVKLFNVNRNKSNKQNFKHKWKELWKH